MFSAEGHRAKCDYCGATVDAANAGLAGWLSFKGGLPSTVHACPGCRRSRPGDIKRDHATAASPQFARSRR